MSLNSLGVSQLDVKAGAGAGYSWGSMEYSGLGSPANYDVIFGTATLGAGGTIAFPITGAVNSAAQANACVFEVWLAVGPAVPAAGAATVGAKFSGIAVFAAGPPAVTTVTINALDDTGAAIAAARNPLGFRIYVPRVGYF